MYQRNLFIFAHVFCFFTQSCFAYTPITIMTAPLGKNSYGHRQVTESLLRGFTQLGVSFVYNPTKLNQLTEVVIVLADPQALRQAVNLKKRGRIKYLLAGPNIMEQSNEHGGIIASPEVDICIVPSQWVARAYEEDMPSLKGRIICWYAGVDTDHWCRVSHHKAAGNNVLIYWKTEPEEFVVHLESVVREYGLNPIRLRYGFHTAQEYKAVLNQVDLAIFISRSESQGIALAEAWSMNVPTLVWNPSELARNGRIYSEVSASPYLTASTGCMWKEVDELRAILHKRSSYSFCPRQWVIETMTYKISARILHDCIQQLYL